jgi:hypothetical protein
MSILLILRHVMDSREQKRRSFQESLSSPGQWLFLGVLSLIPCPFIIQKCGQLIHDRIYSQSDFAVFLKWLLTANIALAAVIFSRSFYLYIYDAKKNLPAKQRMIILLASLGATFAFGVFILVHTLAGLPTPILPPSSPRLNTIDSVIIMYGRPFRKRGKVHASMVKKSTDWLLNDRFSKPKHSWLESARGEHSSVAAFSKLSIELGQLGCPPELLAATHQAALDEINHAQVAFTLDATDGTPKGPAEERGVFGEAGHAFRLQRMALSTFSDGCLYEARSALLLKKMATEEPNETIKKEIERITREEETHVDLAWKIVAWCFRELKLDAHRQRLFRQLTHILDSSAAKGAQDEEHRAIFNHARSSLQEIYAPAV